MGISVNHRFNELDGFSCIAFRPQASVRKADRFDARWNCITVARSNSIIAKLSTSGQKHKAEALLRWQHPEMGLILPREFIPLAEETGLIDEIGNWVFSEAALHTREWEKLLNSTFQISINKSPVQFMVHAGGMNWAAYIKQIGLPAHSLSIEITEGVLLNSIGSAVEKITELHEAGIELSLDDFGTGYSSMSYLNRFKVDYLKIDQSFICTLAADDDSRKMAATIIMMAHHLGMKAIAEGVETAVQKDWLQEAGCDYAQGFMFSKPVPPEELTCC